MFLNIDKLLLVLILVICTVSDIKYRKVKDRYILAGIIIRPVLFIVFRYYWSEFLYNLLVAIIITIFLFLAVLLCERIFKKQVMGGADIKLIFMCGLYLTMDQLLYALLMAFACAAIGGIVLKIKERNKVYPFVPFLAISVFFVLLPSAIEGYNLACQVGG